VTTQAPATGSTHRLLAEQLARLGLGADAPPPIDEWRALLAGVSAAYAEADQDRGTLERSLETSRREMEEVQALVRSSETQLGLERDKLHRSLATLHATLEASLDGVLVVDQHRQVVNFNHRFLEIFNLPCGNERTGDRVEPLAPGDPGMACPDEVVHKITQLHEPDAASSDELALGDGRIVERYSAPVLLPSGTAFGRVSFFRDVTMRRRAEEEVGQANRFLDSIVENIPHMIFVKDAAALRFIRLNRAGEELLGWDRATYIGKSDFDFFPREQAEFFVGKDREVLNGGQLLDIDEEPIETRHKGLRLLHTKKIPVMDEEGRPQYLLGISRDITDEKRAEQQLREAVAAAESASRTKSGFLSNMSHEMRTPLNSILGFARVLSGERFGTLNERQREYVEYILRAGQHMLNLVNDLLDLRRLEEDRNALARTRLEVAQLVGEALQLVKALSDEKGHAVAVELPPHLPDALADRRAVLQILVNLLSNAVKFTPAAGRITIRAHAGVDHLTIAVEDSGVGIRADDLPRLFTYFEQLGAKHAHSMRGSGIGLALTRALVEKLGGTIKVTSAVGVGSTFEFSIPRWMGPEA